MKEVILTAASILGGIAALIAIIARFWSFFKTPRSEVTDRELHSVEAFLDSLATTQFNFCHHRNDLPAIKNDAVRRIFSLRGHLLQLRENIERKIDKKALVFEVLVPVSLAQRGVTSNVKVDRFIPSKIQQVLKGIDATARELNLGYGSDELLKTDKNFSILESDSDIFIHYGYGGVPHRRGAITEELYIPMAKKGKMLRVKDLKKIFNKLHKEITRWLTVRGLMHVYQERFDGNKDWSAAYKIIEDGVKQHSIGSSDLISFRHGSRIEREMMDMIKSKLVEEKGSYMNTSPAVK